MRMTRALPLLLLLALPATAQESPLEPPELSRYLRWGFLRVRPGFEIANAGYDDNILSTPQSPVSDYTATAYAKLDGLMLIGSRAFLTFTERLGYQAFAENRDQGFPVQRADARLTVPFGRMGAIVDGAWVRDSERPADQQDIRPERDEAGGGVGLIFEPGWRVSVELRRAVRRWRYSDRDFTTAGGQTIDERLDRDDERTTFDLRYRTVGRTSLTLGAFSGTTEFTDLSAGGARKDSDEWQVLPGIAFGEGGSLSGTAEVGWRRITARDPTRPSFSDWIGEIDLTYRPVGRTHLRLDVHRRPGFSVTEQSTYFVDSHAGLRLVYYFNRAFGAEAGTGFGRVEFPDADGSTARHDDIFSYNLALRVRLSENSIGRRIEYRLNLQRYERESSVVAPFDKTLFAIDAVLGF